MHQHQMSPPAPRLAMKLNQTSAWRTHAKRTGWLLLGVAVVATGYAGSGGLQRRLTATALKTNMLEAHNAARREVGLAPMVWNEALAADALAYASQMSQSRRFAHSREVPGRRPQGENLWMGTRDSYSFAEMAGSWIGEQQLYDGGSTDQAISAGTFGETGHYTQIIWRSTRSLGCAVSSNADDDYLVCRYYPAGNVMGRSPLD